MSKDRREETGSQAQTEGDNQRTGKCLKTDEKTDNQADTEGDDQRISKCLKTDEKRQVVRQRQREMIRE